MRRINKQQPLVAFSDFVRLHKPRKWEDLDPNVSKESRCHILLNEQGSLLLMSIRPITVLTIRTTTESMERSLVRITT